jgi:hypothetical protein
VVLAMPGHVVFNPGLSARRLMGWWTRKPR